MTRRLEIKKLLYYTYSREVIANQSEVSMEELRKFYDTFPVSTFSKNESIFSQGVEPQHAYAIKSGIIKLHTIIANGEERINSFAVRDEIIPVCWMFNKTPTTLFYYSAHTDCQLYKIRRDSFNEMIEHSSSLPKILLEHFVNDYVTKSLQIRALEQPRANMRLFLMLDSLCLRYGRRILSDLVRIKIPLTQQDIAHLTGLARETVALELSKLKQSSVVSCANKIYTINILKLRDLIQYDYSTQIEIQG